MSRKLAVLCGGAPAPKGDWESIPLEIWGKKKNIQLKITDIDEKLFKAIPDLLLDMLDIATYVYCADQAITRGGNGIRDFGANWRRKLHFHIAVRCPDFWSQSTTIDILRETLVFLADDEYTFHFSELKNAPANQEYLDLNPDPLTGITPQEVILFSGGLDSLAGAINEIALEGKKAFLVSHRSAPVLSNRQTRLLARLKSKIKGKGQFVHVPVWIHKQGTRGREGTQRTRTFLYASLSFVVARLFGLDRVKFYENGITSLNLPISEQLVGARASRSTHPRALAGFSKLFSHVAEAEFKVENPFFWKTKGEVVNFIGEAGFAELIASTVSCVDTRHSSQKKSHCGTCSQCVLRRFAALCSDYSETESAEKYRIDLAKDPLESTKDRTMVSAFVRTALKWEEILDDDFFNSYPEAVRALGHLQSSSNEAAIQLIDLHRRHGREVVSVVKGLISAHPDSILRGNLAKNCLLRMLVEEGITGQLGDVSTDLLVPKDKVCSCGQGALRFVDFAELTKHIDVSYQGLARMKIRLRRAGLLVGKKGSPRYAVCANCGAALYHEADLLKKCSLVKK